MSNTQRNSFGPGLKAICLYEIDFFAYRSVLTIVKEFEIANALAPTSEWGLFGVGDADFGDARRGVWGLGDG